jgi:hypothetical protein
MSTADDESSGYGVLPGMDQGGGLINVTFRGCYAQSLGGHQRFKNILTGSCISLPKMMSRSDQQGAKEELGSHYI